MRSRSVDIAACSVLCCVIVACGGGKDSTRPETPIATSISLQPAGSNLEIDALGGTIQLTAAVRDQHGDLMPSASVSYATADAGIVTVNSAGLVAAVANGTARITATSGSASTDLSIVVDQKEYELVALSGDQQAGTVGDPLALPLVVRVNDRLGHPVAEVQVAFHAATGNGDVSPATASTNASGLAQTTWTTGNTAGAQHVMAVVTALDSVQFSATVVEHGSATGTLEIAPDTLIEGAQVTITGGIFSTTLASNVVAIDGVAATVSAATATSLSVSVPHFACSPPRVVTVTVQTTGQPLLSADAPIRPAAYTSLAIGEEAIVQDPTKFCFQFAARTDAALEVYVMGLSAPAEVPGAVLPFEITARSGATALGAIEAPLPLASLLSSLASGLPQGATAAAAVNPRSNSTPLLRRSDTQGRNRAELRIRQWEATHLPALVASQRTHDPGVASMRALGDVVSTPAVGDTMTLRVSDFGSSNPCAEYATIKATVRVIGSAGIWVEDVANPTTDSLTLADIQAASDQFDSRIYATDTTYFGRPSDIDGNGRVIVALTREVNKAANLLGFVFGGDLIGDTSICPQSNGGEIYYGEVPDPDNVLGTGARSRAEVIARMPQLIAHEFTHIIQNSQRLIINAGLPMAGWEMEGQATLAEELVAHAVLGNMPGQNYDRYTAFGAAGANWYADELLKLDAYFGVLGPNNQAANTPDLCTVYGSLQLTTTPCDLSAFYGASWALQRYIADQYGPSYPGGAIQLTRDWISRNPTASGTNNIASLLGVDYDQLFVRFATALALDDLGNLSGTAWVPSEFRITSWNTADIAAHLNSCCQLGWLTAPSMGFVQASASRSVRGGSTAYTVIASNASHAGTSFQITDLSGDPVSTGLRPALWIVRVQ